ncbi:Tetratricopeptide repeat protein 19, mitochondrial [Datura stramonium]|uniref:Tetratricopeptide repeat protein 19, mitochondrial n=1 Tax=Datura stramonium TaxID=4076 RepID=A0ABS8ULN5_DATST|nr:Tetratricopeptide repeat protein 19, mitochondrial [Datura stramonium]
MAMAANGQKAEVNYWLQRGDAYCIYGDMMRLYVLTKSSYYVKVYQRREPSLSCICLCRPWKPSREIASEMADVSVIYESMNELDQALMLKAIKSMEMHQGNTIAGEAQIGGRMMSDLWSMGGMREEKLGTANPDVDDEKRRLTELLRESGE